jgi:hypothetical protein
MPERDGERKGKRERTLQCYSSEETDAKRLKLWASRILGISLPASEAPPATRPPPENPNRIPYGPSIHMDYESKNLKNIPSFYRREEILLPLISWNGEGVDLGGAQPPGVYHSLIGEKGEDYDGSTGERRRERSSRVDVRRR